MQEYPLVLIVDDDRELVELIKFNFEQRKWRVVVSYDGMDAVLKVNHHIPDIIISDIMMPGIDGYSLLETVKKDPKTKDVPFILISGKKAIENKIRGLKEGAEDYLVKPFVFEELFARAKAHLSISKKIRNLESEGIRGNLAVMPIIDIIQNLSVSTKSGMLKIDGSENKGIIYLNQGKVVKAKFGQRTGWPAFYMILTQNKGFFSFEEGLVEGREFDQNLERMILEFAHQYDEEKKMLKSLGSVNSLFKICSEIEVKDDELLGKLIKMIKDKKEIEDMIRLLPYSSYDIIEKLFTLKSEGYIDRMD